MVEAKNKNITNSAPILKVSKRKRKSKVNVHYSVLSATTVIRINFLGGSNI